LLYVHGRAIYLFTSAHDEVKGHVHQSEKVYFICLCPV
jgi:hypothetical protein